jgi:(p)ppGpp synthase/HD superfamily hydrolase
MTVALIISLSIVIGILLSTVAWTFYYFAFLYDDSTKYVLDGWSFSVEKPHMKELDIVEKARTFAFAAHAATGQTRKYSGEPYIVHPAQVVEVVSTVEHTPEMLAAAWLHDVVEDTKVTIEQIEQEFGKTVADLVGWLTDVSKPEHGNRAARKQIDRDHSAAAPPEAQTIKLADLICNTRDIVSQDPGFAKVYIAEKKLLLKVMDKGDKKLLAQALAQAS